jgi:L-threonylcarbamoyladenylate synthase
MQLDRQYAEEHKGEIVEAIRSGKIFIYPTDTIYGIGCNALIDTSVERVRTIKNRPDNKPFSIIAPSKEWIIENCEVSQAELDKYLPGPYTLFLRKEETCQVSKFVNTSDDTLGVRIPDHWFTSFVAEAGVPFVTTSVNLSGEEYMKKLEDLSPEILNAVDYVVYEGEIDREPSIKVNLI